MEEQMTRDDPDSQAAQDLRRLAELKRELDELQAVAYRSAEKAKADKKAVEAQQEEINDFIDEINTPRPLFQGPAPERAPAPAPAPPAPAPPPEDDAWKAEPIDVLTGHGLTAKQVAKLAEADVSTMGDLADVPELTAIKGVGPALAEKIADAAVEFHAARKAAAIDLEPVPEEADIVGDEPDHDPDVPEADPGRRPYRLHFAEGKGPVAMDDVRRRLGQAILACPNLDFLLLTKRPEWAHHCLGVMFDGNPPPENLWLGVSAEDQAAADERIPQLLQVGGIAVRFASFEPLLGPIDARRCGAGDLDWAIIGGESGDRHRPMDPRWLIDLADHLARDDVPTFIKQDSGRLPDRRGRIPAEYWARKQSPEAG